MTRARLLFFGFLGLALVAGATWLTHAVRSQASERAALAARLRALEAEAAALRGEQALAQRELAQAEAQLASLPLFKVRPAAGRPTEIDDWLAHVQRLHELFEQRPDQRIPEMQFLIDADWLRTAKTFPLETEEDVRKALAEIRSHAINRLASRLSPAIRKYLVDPASPRPESAQALAGYLEQPLDPLLLMRYEITDRPRALRSGSNWALRLREAVDPDYDARFTINSDGWYSNSGLLAWEPELEERYRQATRSYAKANPNASSRDVENIIPYFDPPLEPTLAARLIRAERRP